MPVFITVVNTTIITKCFHVDLIHFIKRFRKEAQKIW